jgi:uncharacterized protein
MLIPMLSHPEVDRTTQNNSRIELIDALRGSALAGILLLHSIEHWDFMRYPQNPPAWLQALNTRAHDAGFFLFGGKAYAVFAMMFGVSFFLILERWEKRGVDFKKRFLWRLILLGIFGYINGIIYCGDILLIIAVLGVPLVFIYRFGNRALAWLSVLLVLQIPSLWQVAQVAFVAGYQSPVPIHGHIYGELAEVYAHGTVLDVIKTNLWHGHSARLWWTFETGRYTQMIGLFVWGLLLGRSRIFEDPVRSARLARRALLCGIIGFAIVYPIKQHVGDWGLHGPNRSVVGNWISSYLNLTQLAILVGGFIYLYQWTRTRSALRLLAPFGRMSLTCYVAQGLIGVPLFYGFGFALYRYCGPFYSVLIGVALVSIQCAIAHLWLKCFAYGPLEWLWRALTFGSFSMPMRKARVTPSLLTDVALPLSH